MVKIVDQIDPNLRKNISAKKSIAVIPVGSIEQHGPHLPISTDSDIVTHVAGKICEKSDFLLLPTINYGVSYEHAPFFQLSVNQTTLLQVLSDIIESLHQNKINTVFVINGHHGNQKALNRLCKKIEKKLGEKIRIWVFSYWHFMSRRFDHAGFVETSLMLAISKKVKMNKAQKGLLEDKFSPKELKIISKKASKSFPKVTKNGVWGDPTKASALQGRKILSQILTNLNEKCQTCLTGNRPKLHK